MKKYKIVAVVQIHNELRKGNLERFFQYIKRTVDDVVVYDDFSTDGSYEYAKGQCKNVIRGLRNDFKDERQHKKLLLEKALELKADFVIHVDADEVVTDNDGQKLQKLAQWVIDNDLDGALLHDINLWRSTTWKRIDSDFGQCFFQRFWRMKPGIGYTDIKKGFHQSSAPDGLKKFEKTDIVSLLHFGFADVKNIVNKYICYGLSGQRGYDLARLIDEEKQFVLEKVDKGMYPKGLWKEEEKPKLLSVAEYYKEMEKYKDELFKPSVTIVCLIYKSVKWLNFVYEQVLKNTDLNDKEFYFVANDATEEVKQYLHNNYIPHYIFDNSPEQKKDWYINNVYRAWNFAASKAKGDYVLFINSDMAFSNNWVENLFSKINGKNCVTSRLVESGKLTTGGLNVEKFFGYTPDDYNEKGFLELVSDLSVNKTEPGGAYMPLLIKKDVFLAVDGYPEGNVKKTSKNLFKPEIAEKGEELINGDDVLMQKLKTKDVHHVTSFDSVVYHFQEGEMSDEKDVGRIEKNHGLILVNNCFQGNMKEKNMWNFMLERLPNITGIDSQVLGSEDNFEEEVEKYIADHDLVSPIVLQNASFIDLVAKDKFNMVFLQDNLRKMGKVSYQQESNLNLADVHITNSINTAADYPEYYFRVISLGVNAELFKSGDKLAMRQKLGIKTEKVGIFVGDLTEVKGWNSIKKVIDDHREITWIIVSKDVEKYIADNVIMFNRIDQETLVTLHQASDFFILGSPVETQCLAAVEAGMCGLPIIMHNVGIFADFSEEEKLQCGIFGDDFEAALTEIFKRKFDPRKILLEKELDVEGMIKKWWNLIAEIQVKNKLPIIKGSLIKKERRKISFLKKMKIILSNKNYIVTLLRKKTSPAVFNLILKVWRTGKKYGKKLS